MTTPLVPSPLAALALGCLATSAWAEPVLEFRALVGTSQVGIDPALVPPASVSRLAMFDPLHALIRTQTGENYLSDGVSLRRVMVAGTQIPGQPEGVIWGGTFRNEIWPLESGGSYFSAIASGGDLGAPSNVLFAGDLESPDILGWGRCLDARATACASVCKRPGTKSDRSRGRTASSFLQVTFPRA